MNIRRDRQPLRSCQSSRKIATSCRRERVAEEKALHEIEYVRKGGDARLAAINVRQEPTERDTHHRVRDNEDDDGIGETKPPPPRGFCPSGYVFRPTGRRDSQNIREQVQANELVYVETSSWL